MLFPFPPPPVTKYAHMINSEKTQTGPISFYKEVHVIKHGNRLQAINMSLKNCQYVKSEFMRILWDWSNLLKLILQDLTWNIFFLQRLWRAVFHIEIQTWALRKFDKEGKSETNGFMLP